MTRTNKRIKQGNTRKIKIITILQLYQRESYPNICRLYINNTLVYIYKHESALLVIEDKYIQNITKSNRDKVNIYKLSFCNLVMSY